MKRVKDVLEYLNEVAPVSLKMDFDNVGLLVGSGDAVVNRCLVSLDISDEVIAEAESFGAQLIVSHHPVIFDELKSVTSDDLTGRKIIALIRGGMSAICMHTNLDIAHGGVNDALATALGAVPISALEPVGDVGCGRICEYEKPVDFGLFLEMCKKSLNANGLRYYSAGRPVKRLALMGGAGGSSLRTAFEAGCDTYVTADIKYNTFLDAKELGLNLIDADHFCTENVVIPVLHERLSVRFPEIMFRISERHCQTVQFYA